MSSGSAKRADRDDWFAIFELLREHRPVVHVVAVLNRIPELARWVVNGFQWTPTETNF